MRRFLFAAMALTLLVGCDPLREGRNLMAEGKYEEAARFYLAKTRENPKDYLALNELGYVYTRMDMLGKAMEAYSEAIKAKPDFFPAYLNLGTIYLKSGDVDRAFEYLKKAVELNPESEAAHANLAWTLAAAWRPEEAEEHLQQAIKLSGGKNKYQDLAEAIAQRKIEKVNLKSLREKMQAEMDATLAAQGGSTAEPTPAPPPAEPTPSMEPGDGSSANASAPGRRGREGRGGRRGGREGQGGQGGPGRDRMQEDPN